MRRILLLPVLILLICFMMSCSKSVSVVNDPGMVRFDGEHPANNKQHEASVWLGCYEGSLYFLTHSITSSSNKTDYHLQLGVLENGSARKILSLNKDGNIHVLGFEDGCLYYWENHTRGTDVLYCYSMEDQTETVLYKGEREGLKTEFFSEDGSAYFPLYVDYEETPQFVHVAKDKVIAVEPLTEGYCLGDKTYSVIAEYGDAVERILRTDTYGNAAEIPLGLAYRRSIIPYENGLLIHNESHSELLYKIDEEGMVTKLFEIPCLTSKSAVNIHGTDVYLSLLRYEKYGEFGKLRYENDSVEGTYRISLIDNSVVKISDNIFNGLYNFDDTCFYCCDEKGNIYKMDFDGTVTPILQTTQ